MNPVLTDRARSLRRNMTKEERHLWYDFLKTHAVPFHRQKVIGNYIVDFHCQKAQLVIELDGSQHYEDKEKQYDAVRTAFLLSLGLMVIRIPNNEVNQNFSGVCEYIDNIISQRLSP